MSTFSGTMSTAVTWLCWLRRVAIDNPTYPVPATAIFMIIMCLLYRVLESPNITGKCHGKFARSVYSRTSMRSGVTSVVA